MSGLAHSYVIARLIPKQSLKIKGFTLIELLVVIAILAILTIVAVSIFRGVSNSAEDGRRRTDINAISKAYEVTYNNVTGQYKVLTPTDFGSGNIPELSPGVPYGGLISSAQTGFQVCTPLTANPNPTCSASASDCVCIQSQQGVYTAGPPPPPPPPSCSLTSASWVGGNPVVEGTNVTLQVVGDSNCSSSDSMAFDIRENDGPPVIWDDDFSPDPTVTFNNLTHTWTANWTSVFMDDSDDPLSPPGDEYFFNAILNGGSPYTSTAPLLVVTQAPPPNQPPTCSSISGPSSLTTSQSGSYTATASDPESGPLTYSWTASAGSPTSSSASTFNWTAPATSGNQTINVTVTDNGGLQAACPVKSVTINAPPSYLTGVVAHWRMDQSSWNGTGGEVVDSSGNGNNGTAFNGATTTAGQPGFGNTGSFDGVNDYVDIGNSASLNPANSITISAWVKPNVLTTEGIVSKESGGVQYVLRVNSTAGIILFRLFLNGILFNLNTTQTIPVNSWSHVVGTYNGSQMNVYINGVLATGGSPLAATGSMANNLNSVKIGSLTGVQYFNGSIDNVRIYNRALTATEVNQLYTNEPN